MKKDKRAKIILLSILILFLSISVASFVFAYGDGPSDPKDRDSYVPPDNTEWDSVRWDINSGGEFSHLTFEEEFPDGKPPKNPNVSNLTFEEEFGDGRPLSFPPPPWQIDLYEDILEDLDHLDIGATAAGTPVNIVFSAPFAFVGGCYAGIKWGTRRTYYWITDRAESDNRRTSESSTVEQTKKRLFNWFSNLDPIPPSADGSHPSSRIR